MYNSTRKIFGFDDSELPTIEASKKPFMRRPVQFQTAATEVLPNDQETTQWSIIDGFDNHGHYRLLVPPGTILCNIERPRGYPNFTPYIPPKISCPKIPKAV
jgi:hypothetical protein